MKLKDRVAIVTGGSSGIGRGVAIELAQEGAHVSIADVQEEPKRGKYHDQDLVTTTGAEVDAAGRRSLFVRTDMGDDGAVSKLVEQTISEFGRLDVIVNNAGIHIPGDSQSLSVADWDRVVGVNLRGLFLLTKFAVPHLRRSPAGRIINIASVAPWLGRGTIDYNAAKAGVLAVTRSIARQYGPTGIRCNTIAPSLHKTPMADRVLDSKEGRDYLDSIPLGFVPGPDSVAKAALFLASDESYYISGHCMLVDGGLTLR